MRRRGRALAVMALAALASSCSVRTGPPSAEAWVGFHWAIQPSRGVAATRTPVPVLAGSAVHLVLTVSVPKGKSVECLAVAPYTGTPSGRFEYCGSHQLKRAIYVAHKPLEGGVHRLTMTWKARSFDRRHLQELEVYSRYPPPPGTYDWTGHNIGPEVDYAVIPHPREARAAPAAPLVPECGLMPALTLPSTILLGCGGEQYVTHLHWETWSASGATATGILVRNTCLPQMDPGVNCGSGEFSQFKATVELSDPSTVRGQRIFANATATYHIEWALHDTTTSYRLTS